MDPILDIRTVRPGLFTYSLRAPGQPARPCDDFFDRFEHGLRDAACALLNYFDRVQIHANGVPIGTYTVARLAGDPLRAANELRARFDRIDGDWIPVGLPGLIRRPTGEALTADPAHA